MPPTFFEGTEKKIEVFVDTDELRLRALGRGFWESMVGRAGANVLSVRSTSQCDAYLLSESSLFVCDDQVTMITCGRTRLADAVVGLLDAVPDRAIRYLVYERRNDYFPERQLTTFLEDARALAARVEGTAYRFGDQDDHFVYVFCTDRPYSPDPEDATLEVLMHGVPEAVMRRFIRGEGAVGDSGLAREILGSYIDDFEVDEYFFSPPGYSMNAVRDHVYYTMHVTRESFGTYVSFESDDARCQDPAPLIHRLVDFFQPRSFDTLSFLPDDDFKLGEQPYRIRDHVKHRLRCGYAVTFQHRFRPLDGPRGPLEIPLGGS